MSKLEGFEKPLAFWVPVGAAMGVGSGVAIQSIAVGAGIGVAVGVAIGAAHQRGREDSGPAGARS